MESLSAQIESALLAGGMSAESSTELASYLSLHYPEHAAALLSYVAPEVEPEPSVD